MKRFESILALAWSLAHPDEACPSTSSSIDKWAATDRLSKRWTDWMHPRLETASRRPTQDFLLHFGYWNNHGKPKVTIFLTVCSLLVQHPEQ